VRCCTCTSTHLVGLVVLPPSPRMPSKTVRQPRHESSRTPFARTCAPLSPVTRRREQRSDLGRLTRWKMPSRVVRCSPASKRWQLVPKGRVQNFRRAARAIFLPPRFLTSMCSVLSPSLRTMSLSHLQPPPPQHPCFVTMSHTAYRGGCPGGLPARDGPQQRVQHTSITLADGSQGRSRGEPEMTSGSSAAGGWFRGPEGGRQTGGVPRVERQISAYRVQHEPNVAGGSQSGWRIPGRQTDKVLLRVEGQISRDRERDPSLATSQTRASPIFARRKAGWE
jgi:hypothetical protein